LRSPLDDYLDLGADVIAARPAGERVDISVETILVASSAGYASAEWSLAVSSGRREASSEKPKPACRGVSACFVSAPGRIRTSDQRLRRPSLFH
jgi:hypothetical protein